MCDHLERKGRKNFSLENMTQLREKADTVCM